MATHRPPRRKSFSSKAPYGYRWENDVLAPDPVEAPVRKKIYELLAKLRRKKPVARVLNGEGYRTRDGALWSDTTIDRLVRDTLSKGVYRESGQGPEMPVEAIVSDELWEECNGILGKSGLGTRRGRPAQHIFAGLIVCECGRRMYIPSHSHNYRCSDCGNRIPAHDLEAIFVDELKNQRLGGSHPLFAEVCDRWSALELDEKRSIIESITDRIQVGKDEINITLHQMLTGPQDGSKTEERDSEILVPSKKRRKESLKGENAKFKVVVDPVALAIALMKDHPAWSARKLAQVAGCAHTTLTRSPLYRMARALADAKADRPRGWKGADGSIEAISEANETD